MFTIDQSHTSLVLIWMMLISERESQLKVAQEQAQREVIKAWDQVRELRQRENQLKVSEVNAI